MQLFRTSILVFGLACAGTLFVGAQDRYEGDDRNDRYRDRNSERAYEPRRDYRERDYGERDYADDRRSEYREPQSQPRTIEMSKLPKNVRSAIHKRSGEAEVVRIDQESHRGQVQYRVQTRQNGQRGFFRVASDGSLMGATSQETDWAGNNEGNRRERFQSRDDTDYERRGYDRSREAQFDRGYNAEADYDRSERRRAPRNDSYRGYSEGAYYDGYGRSRNFDSDYDRPMRSDDRARYGARNNRELDRDWDRREWDERQMNRRAWENYDAGRRGGDDREWSRSRDNDWERSEGVSRSRGDRFDDDRDYDRREPGGRLQEWEEQNLKAASLPPEVQATIRKHSGNGNITRIDRESNRGQTRYKVQVNQGGKDTFFHVTPNGEFVGATPEVENKTGSASTSEKPKPEPKVDEKK